MIRHVFHRDRHKHHPPTSLLQEQRPEEAVSVRRHLVDVPYLLPKDLQEIHRLDFQHYALRTVIGSDYVAPINQTTQSILDVGCGTGRWAIEVAKAFPHAQVCGVDIELPTTAYRFHVAMMGMLGIGGHLSHWSEADMVEAARWIAVYKQIRHLVQDGEQHWLISPSSNDGNLAAIEYLNADHSEAVVLAFRRSNPFWEPLPRLRVYNLLTEAHYTVQELGHDNPTSVTLSGAALIGRGIELPFSTSSYQSCLLHIQRS